MQRCKEVYGDTGIRAQKNKILVKRNGVEQDLTDLLFKRKEQFKTCIERHKGKLYAHWPGDNNVISCP